MAGDAELIERVAKVAKWCQGKDRKWYADYMDSPGFHVADEWRLEDRGLRQLEDRLLKAGWELMHNQYGYWWCDRQMTQFNNASREQAAIAAYLAAFEDTAR
jgi:hypothetical protein